MMRSSACSRMFALVLVGAASLFVGRAAAAPQDPLSRNANLMRSMRANQLPWATSPFGAGW